MKRTLTKKHLDAMRLVKNGTDVWCPRLAKLLREIQQINPDLIYIGGLGVRRCHSAEQPPYFAILTNLGAVALRSRRKGGT